MTDLEKALKLFRDAIRQSEDRDELPAEEIKQIETKIEEILSDNLGDPETAVEAAVYEVWPNCSGHWEYDPTRFVI